jgi:hypothetical protein
MHPTPTVMETLAEVIGVEGFETSKLALLIVGSSIMAFVAFLTCHGISRRFSQMLTDPLEAEDSLETGGQFGQAEIKRNRSRIRSHRAAHSVRTYRLKLKRVATEQRKTRFSNQLKRAARQNGEVEITSGIIDSVCESGS